MTERSQKPELDRRDFLLRTAALTVGTLGLETAARSGAVLAISTPQEEAEAFLANYVQGWLPLETAANEASWAALTDVSEPHTTAQVAANQKVNEFVGSPEVIAKVKQLLAHREQLHDLTIRQLEKVRLRTAEAPGTMPEVVTARTRAEAGQAAAQDGFGYTLKREGKAEEHPSANDIDRVLVGSKDLNERLASWEVSKTIGGPLRDGILRLRDLRNKVAQAMGFDDFFALQVADYGMTRSEMIALCDRLIAEVNPLYTQLHAWARHALAKRYQAEAPAGKIPAHWLPNRWGQNWPSLVEGVDMDVPFKGKPEGIYHRNRPSDSTSRSDSPSCRASFWEKSDLYPADPKSGRKKNSHASAWHINLRDDVRSLMSIEPDSRWFTTAHHELGHIYYYISYSTPEVPYLLRAGANRAFHEGIGDLIGLAAGQRPYLKQAGLLHADAEKAPSHVPARHGT